MLKEDCDKRELSEFIYNWNEFRMTCLTAFEVFLQSFSLLSTSLKNH